MVWIYGGGYTTGQKSSYNPIGLLKQSENTTIGPGEGVIFVALNYRVRISPFQSRFLQALCDALSPFNMFETTSQYLVRLTD